MSGSKKTEPHTMRISPLPARTGNAHHGYQRGSVLLPAAASILVGLVLLGTAHLAYLFYMKRELQNAADMAALSGVQMLRPALPGNCAAAIETAQATLAAQPALQNAGDVETDIACGVWDPTTPATAVDPTQQALHFSPTDNAPGQAVYVSLRSNIPAFVPLMQTVALQAKAIARLEPGEPLAAFSVSPQLLALDDGLLTNLLASIGADLRGTTVADRNGLANVMLTPAGLLQALGIALPADLTVASLNELLALESVARVGGAELLRAALELARNGGPNPAPGSELTTVQLSLLENLIDALVVADPVIQLGSLANGPRGLFAHINADDPNAALNTRISLGSIVDSVLAFATRERAIDVPAELNLLGVLRGSVKIGIVEPPSIGIGGAGTMAYGAQIRAFVELCASLGNCSTTGGSMVPTGLLDLGVHIPIGLELVTGHGTLDSLCEEYDEQGQALARITVQASLANACIGNISASDVFSTSFSCRTPLDSKELLRLRLLGHNLLSLNTSISGIALEDVSTVTLAAGETADVPANGNALAIGTTLASLTDELLSSLAGKTPANGSGTRPGAQQIWNETLAEENCNPASGPFNGQGFACRKAVEAKALRKIETGFNGLIGNIVDNLLRLDLLNLVGDLLGDLLGVLLPTDTCAGATLSGLPPYAGTASGCVDKLNSVLQKTNSQTGVPLLLQIVLDILRAPLDALGQTLSNLLANLGINLGQVRTELISLECGRPRAQLVH
ncbi:hypothetical protein FMZ60_00830 [Alcaligenaceae bacterium SJ-26]|nr:hypothetical protein FMZ60_00830 [Alcaligenaceae bacterium SJ-26]